MAHHPSLYGTPCKLTLDVIRGDGDPEDGIFLATPAGSCYRIVDARKVRSKINPRRWRVEAVRMDPAEVPDDAEVWEFSFYRRKRSRPPHL